MSLAALIGYIVFLLVALGWRSFRQYRRTGDTGFRGLSSRSAIDIVGGFLFVSGALVSMAALILDIVGWMQVFSGLGHLAVHIPGFALVAAGFALTLAAQIQMGDSWRIGVDNTEQTALVTGGVFRYMRNPIFSGMLAALLGLFLLVPNPLTLAGWLMVVCGLEIQVRSVEEPYLLKTHGESYRQYTQNTGRFLPWFGRSKM